MSPRAIAALSERPYMWALWLVRGTGLALTCIGIHLAAGTLGHAIDTLVGFGSTFTLRGDAWSRWAAVLGDGVGAVAVIVIGEHLLFGARRLIRLLTRAAATRTPSPAPQ